MKTLFRSFMFLFILLKFCIGCESSKVNVISSSDMTLYKNAYEIKHKKNEDMRIETVSYKVDLKYPSYDVIDYYKKLFKEIGYVSCDALNEQYGNKKWTGYIDGVGEKEIYIHRAQYFWENVHNNEVVMLFVYYESPITVEKYAVSGRGIKEKIKPELLKELSVHPTVKTQKIVLQRLRGANTDEMCKPFNEENE